MVSDKLGAIQTALARGLGQAIVAGVTVDLEGAVEAGEKGFGILAPAAGGVSYA